MRVPNNKINNKNNLAMKKIFILATIASVALAGCTKNELAAPTNEQEVITFADPVAHVVTKTVLTPVEYPTTSSFSVFADYHKNVYATDKSADTNFSAYMRGTEGVDVTHKTTAIGEFDSYWSPATPYYWPKDGYLTFAAYSPASAKENAAISYSIFNGISIQNYEVKQDLTNQCDLMLSNRVSDQKSTDMVTNSPSPYDGVQLTFSHVLSAIKFTVATDIDYSAGGYTITLNTLKVKNAYKQGDLKQFANKDVNAVALANIWSNVDTEETTGYTVCGTDKPLSTRAVKFSEDIDADLVLLPQGLDHTANSGGKVTAEVVYTIAKAGESSIQYTANLDLSGKTDGKWDAGKRYIYEITIGMEQVVFAPTVTGWDTQTAVPL